MVPNGTEWGLFERKNGGADEKSSQHHLGLKIAVIPQVFARIRHFIAQHSACCVIAEMGNFWAFFLFYGEEMGKSPKAFSPSQKGGFFCLFSAIFRHH